jgi:thiamine-phosphate pyrophosphorylase
MLCETMKKFVGKLHLVTDRKLCGNRSVQEVVALAVQGGVDMVQLRDKSATSQEFLELARTLKQLLLPFNIPLIINDRIDIALTVNADGAHIGQSDMPYLQARNMLGHDKIIGVSVSSLAELTTTLPCDADYLGVGPIFSTMTKSDAAQPLGIAGLAKLRASSTHTLIAIGGINHTTINDVIATGIDGVAVVSAICAAPQPKQAAYDLQKIMQSRYL